ncbi:MAG: 2-oxoglutarate oxidoreductase [Deltaproteobacteria bacterium]|nr:MAG: 2-oxoglutarate oxidoreductase [Deltaproteobacteria bacterium]
MKKVFSRPKSLIDRQTHFCPGCTHGTAHRLVADAIDHFGVQEETIGVSGVGCAVFMYDYFAIDAIEAPHGRAPAVATGIKRVHPKKIVFTYQGDGDLASIGTAETIHTANRGENITIIFINNTVYGMTGGQMAPTTLLGQQTTTTPYGRNFQNDGYPIRMAEMLATLEGVAYSTRVSMHNAKEVLKAKKAVRRAFQMQIEGMGLTFVELLSACHTNWRVKPLEGQKRVEEELIPYFPLGVFKERKGKDFL